MLIAAVLGFGAYFHAWPAYRYYNAVRQLENGVYSSAKSEFDTLAARQGKRSLPVKIEQIGLDIDLFDLRMFAQSAELSKECTYRQAVETMATGTIPALRTAQDAFDGLADYRDSADLALEARYRRAQLLMNARQYDGVLALCDEMGGYKDTARLRSGAEYQLAAQAMDAGNYEEAREKFLALGSYEDAANRAKLCLYQPATAAIDAGDFRTAIDLLTRLEPGFEATQFKLREAYYGLASQLFDAQDYDAAAEYYLLAGDYRDAFSQATACLYEPACLQMEAGEYEKAKEMFDKISSFRDSLEKSWQCSEALGRMAMDAGDYEQARTILGDALQYEPAQALLLECYYIPAVQLQEAGQIDDALALFASIGGYKDTDERVLQLRYAAAEALMAENKYAEAEAAFEALADYADSPARLKEARRSLAMQQLEAGEYENAIAGLEALEDPEGTAEALARAHYEWGKQLQAENKMEAAAEHLGLAGEYQDARALYEKAMYDLAEAAIAADDYEQAATYLKDITNYADAAALRDQSVYHTAQVHAENGELKEAAVLFASLGEYQDAADRAAEIYDAYYGDAYRQAKEAIEARDYPAALAALESVDRENATKEYGDMEKLYQEVNYLYANQLYDEKKPFEALPYYRRVPEYKDTARRLDRVCYRMLGRWVSRTGVEMEFREDGTCTIDGKACYFWASQFVLLTGDKPDSLKTEWTIHDCQQTVLSIENNKSHVQYRLTRIEEE